VKLPSVKSSSNGKQDYGTKGDFLAFVGALQGSMIPGGRRKLDF
jgi:hypothetical protein